MSLYWNEFFIIDVSERVLEHLDHFTLARIGRTDNHKSMTHCDCLIELDAFLNELWFRLQVELLTHLKHRALQKFIVRRWQFDTREKIIRDTSVKRNVIGSELGQIDILECSQANLVF